MAVVHRLLRIIVLLQSSAGPWGRPRLADVLGTNTTTVSRDINRLQKGGVPVEYDKVEKTYRIRHGFYLPPTAFTVPEAVALSVLAGGPAATGHFLAGPAAQGAEKVRASLPEPLREELNRTLPAIALDPARAETADVIDDVWFKMSQSIAQRRSLICCYEASQSETDVLKNASGNAAPNTTPAPAAFTFYPYALYFGQRGWYVIGKRLDRDALRTLKLSRFVRIANLDTPYAIPDDFSLKTYFGNAWRMMRGNPRHAIKLHFSAKVADTVSETQWHATQRITEHNDGSITADFDIDGLDEIVWWILGYGPNCTVEAPNELREKIARLAQETAQQYEKGKDDG